jgi:hypothetical protein
MMANGTLVRTLIHTDVTKYLSFKAVDGSYVFSKGKVYFSIYALLFSSSFYRHIFYRRFISRNLGFSAPVGFISSLLDNEMP